MCAQLYGLTGWGGQGLSIFKVFRPYYHSLMKNNPFFQISYIILNKRIIVADFSILMVWKAIFLRSKQIQNYHISYLMSCCFLNSQGLKTRFLSFKFPAFWKWFSITSFLCKFSIGSRNGLAPTWRQAISWTNDEKDIKANMQLSGSIYHRQCPYFNCKFNSTKTTRGSSIGLHCLVEFRMLLLIHD